MPLWREVSEEGEIGDGKIFVLPMDDCAYRTQNVGTKRSSLYRPMPHVPVNEYWDCHVFFEFDGNLLAASA